MCKLEIQQMALIKKDFMMTVNYVESGCIATRLGDASLNCINFTVPMNIATTKLIQWKAAEILENKAY